ncbi:YceI family protein [Nonomuraea jabiensis]|uniref:YceI family protein n=1 Tax=Nonomuraea jabiensis TaxID=882448 RepID=UPI0034323DEC
MARHAMVTKVRGSIPVKEATASLNADDPAASTVHVVLYVAGIQTGNQHRDDHLRTGELTIRRVTRQVTVPLDYTGTAIDAQSLTRVGFEGSTVINRKDFGITYNAVLETGGVMISEKVTLEFDLSAVKAPADRPVR